MNAKRSKRPADDAGYGEMPRQMGAEENGRDFLSDSETRQTFHSTGQAVREEASTIAANIGQELSKGVDDQKRRGLEAVRSFADAVNTAAQSLEQQSPQMAQYARDAADRLQSFTSEFEKRSTSDLLRSASDLARSKPGLFMIGAVAAGFALARFMKSSASSEAASYEQDEWSPGESDREYSRSRDGEGEIAYGNP
jgi:hypothetical protein